MHGVPHLGARVAHLLRLASKWGAIGSRHSEKGSAAPSGSSPAPERPSLRSSPGGSSPSSNDSHSHRQDSSCTPCNGACECQAYNTEIPAEKDLKKACPTARACRSTYLATASAAASTLSSVHKTATTCPAMTEKRIAGQSCLQTECPCLFYMPCLQAPAWVALSVSSSIGQNKQPTFGHPSLLAVLRVCLHLQNLLACRSTRYSLPHLRLTRRAACADTGGERAQDGRWEGIWQAAHVRQASIKA